MKNENRNRVGITLMLLAIVLFAGGITFAFFRAGVTGEQEKLTVTTGTLALTFSDNNTGITKNKLQLGESTTKEFKIENTGNLDATTNMLWNNLVNTYTEGSLTYTFEYSTNETGPWTAVPNTSGDIPQSESATDKNLATELTIPAHATYYYQLTITLNHLADVDQTADKDAVLSSNFKLGDKILTPSETTLAKLKVSVKPGNPTFTNMATEDETSDGLYSLPDDYGTSYYYRGAVTNNYVKFAGFYWRIIRVNGDGSLRMIYDGTVAHKNGEGNETFTITGIDGVTTSADRFINNGATTAFNPSYNDNAYVGWMYGQTGQSGTGAYDRTHANTTNSTIKNTVNTWYDNNLASYDQYIADTVYCNDRSTPGSDWSDDTGLGYARNATAYGAASRLVDTSDMRGPKANAVPQFTCPNKNDAFTVNDSVHGNAIGDTKSRKIGLITADEIVAAGGRYFEQDGSSKNNKFYLYKGSWYWSLSPIIFSSFSSGRAYVFRVDGNGNLDNYFVNEAYGAVAPVISIKAEYASKITGSGTASDPYTIPGVA